MHQIEFCDEENIFFNLGKRSLRSCNNNFLSCHETLKAVLSLKIAYLFQDRQLKNYGF